MRAIFRGTGMYVPPIVVDNNRLSRVMDTSDEWIRQRTGIVTRHFADVDQATSDMALPAAEAAVQDAGMSKSDIDYVIFATMTPDHYFPGSGPVFQKKFGLTRVPCLDIRVQCTGFLYGMQLSDPLPKIFMQGLISKIRTSLIIIMEFLINEIWKFRVRRSKVILQNKLCLMKTKWQV